MGPGISKAWASQASESKYYNSHGALEKFGNRLGKNSKSLPVIILT
jgi:hypothetical protein